MTALRMAAGWLWWAFTLPTIVYSVRQAYRAYLYTRRGREGDGMSETYTGLLLIGFTFLGWKVTMTVAMAMAAVWWLFENDFYEEKADASS